MNDTHQSVITDTSAYPNCFHGIPSNIEGICRIVQGLLIHVQDAPLLHYTIPERRKKEMNARSVNTMLHYIFALDPKSLLHPRPVEQRMIATCRDFAVLTCSVLRHLNIPARIRFGFSRYYYPQFFHDSVLVEYWNNAQRRWCYVDARTHELQISGHHFRVHFDLHDIPAEQFILASQAWQWCRTQSVKATRFGSGSRREIKGLWYVRNKLVQDLAAFNGDEMLPWDVWGFMLDNPFGVDPTDTTELNTMDKIAALFNKTPLDLVALKKMYTHPKLKVPSCLL